MKTSITALKKIFAIVLAIRSAIFLALFLAILCLEFFVGCATLSSDSLTREQQMREILRLEQITDEGPSTSGTGEKRTEAIQGLQKFLLKYPASVFSQRAHFAMAKNFEQSEAWSQAAQQYRAAVSISSDKEISGNALMRLAWCYESLGDDEAAIATLFEARRLGRELPAYLIEAEIPLRLSLAFSRLGQDSQAEEFQDLTVSGLVKVRGEMLKTTELKKDYARFLFQMGRVSLDQLGVDNFYRNLRAYTRAAPHLIEAASLQINPWSEKALENLKMNLIGFWNVIESLPQAEKFGDKGRQMAVALSVTMDQVETRLLVKDDRFNAAEYENLIKELQSKGLKLFYRVERFLPLTEEALEFNSIKRKLILRDIQKSDLILDMVDPNL